MECLICSGNKFKPYYYPSNQFNGKVFEYYECCGCYSAQISPLPDDDDMKKMYGSNDHSYLLAIKDGELLKYPTTYPKYNHQGIQLNFFNTFNYKEKCKTLLDIGCGSGFYMNNAKRFGFKCYGIEFSQDFAKLLRQKTNQDIYSFEEFYQYVPEETKFDIIHLGHVLEHSTHPKEFLEMLKKFAHKTTIFVVDGPLEKNKCLSRWFIKLGSLVKGNKLNNYDPQHITFTNYKSQLHFFETLGLKKINYSVTEQMFPFPSTIKGQSMKGILMFIVGRISVNLSKLHPKLGNVFHYAGQFK